MEVVPAAEADNFVKDKTAAAPLLKPFTPDHIVYCGPYPLFVENIDEAKNALDAFMTEHDKEPRLILVQGVGAFKGSKGTASGKGCDQACGVCGELWRPAADDR